MPLTATDFAISSKKICGGAPKTPPLFDILARNEGKVDDSIALHVAHPEGAAR
jgi:hypothetical protein